MVGLTSSVYMDPMGMEIPKKKSLGVFAVCCDIPICSMYGIFTYTYHKNQPNVGKYSEIERLKEIDPKIALGVFYVPLEVRIRGLCHPNIRPL